MFPTDILQRLLIDVSDVRSQSSVASEKDDERADIDGVMIVQQLERALQKGECAIKAPYTQPLDTARE